MAVGVHVTLEYFRGFRFQKWFLAIRWLDMARAMDIHIHYQMAGQGATKSLRVSQPLDTHFMRLGSSRHKWS